MFFRSDEIWFICKNTSTMANNEIKPDVSNPTVRPGDLK